MFDFSDAPKRATNLSLSVPLLDLAREMNLNLSQTVDRLLADEIRRRYREHWLARNESAIDAYNARVRRGGVPLARYRRFLRPGPDE